MRSSHLIAIAMVLAVGLGVKLLFFSAPNAVANVDAVNNSSIDVSKIHVDPKLPVQKIPDMTFVFADND